MYFEIISKEQNLAHKLCKSILRIYVFFYEKKDAQIISFQIYRFCNQRSLVGEATKSLPVINALDVRFILLLILDS
jgi:hypothetical protein